MHWIERPLRVVDHITTWAIGLMLAVITLVLFTYAVARYFAGFTIIGGEELARCLMVWMTFLGAYLLVRTRGHVAIDLVSKALTGRWAALLNTLIAIVGIITCAYVAHLGWNLTNRIFSTGQRMSSLPLARGWFYLPVPIGFGLMTLAFAQMLIASWTGVAHPMARDFGPRQDRMPAASEGR
jgi:TRAP-type C4-dicarboxylate transport system permease small subunit